MSVSELQSDPNERLGFEIGPVGGTWAFTPEFYPTTFRQAKSNSLEREGAGETGENVVLETVKNREFHAEGRVLESELSIINRLVGYDEPVEIISPIVPYGGMECMVKEGEVRDEEVGWDPVTSQRYFQYTIDLVSTGRDEYDRGSNRIVSAILSGLPEPENAVGGSSSIGINP